MRRKVSILVAIALLGMVGTGQAAVRKAGAA